MKKPVSKARALAALLLACGLSACTLYRAHEDLGDTQALANVAGAIEAPPGSTHPLLVGLFREEAGRKTLAAYFVRYGSGPFRFIVAPGNYHLFAFEDANGNLGYDDGEAIYYVGERQPAMRLQGGAYDAGTIQLSPRTLDVAELKAAAARGLASDIALASVHRGTVVRLDDPRFTVESGKEGMWTPLQSVVEHGAGLFFLEPYDPARVPVVFVHGMSGTAGDFRALAESLDHRKFQAWFFHYPSGVRVETAAAFLQSMLAEMQARHRFERYIVVAHSAGGLVSRSALLRIQREGGAMPCAFITLSTPWGGIESAETGTKRSPVVLSAWIDLAPGSKFIKTLFDTPLRPSVATYLYFGYTGGNGTDGAVALESMLRPAAQQQAGRIRGFAESHRGILRARESVAAVNASLQCAGESSR